MRRGALGDVSVTSGTLFPLISRRVITPEAFTAPVPAPDFKGSGADPVSRRRVAALYGCIPLAPGAPSARQLHLGARRWLHFGDTAATGFPAVSMSDLI